jgi:energy-coupling factor transporter ATP-binding protein EcfA2
MTGRENIYLNGAILGMSRAEIDAKFDQIVEFTELGEFLEAPLSTYSSGMRVKLGFGVAIHREPDILLIDEVLSVGDYAFVNKSLRQLYEYRLKAKALIYVTHNLEQIRNLCDRVIVLDQGCLARVDSADHAVAFYQGLCADAAVGHAGAKTAQRGALVAVETDDVEFVSLNIISDAGVPTSEVGVDAPLRIAFRFRLLKGPKSVFFSVGIHDEKRNVAIWMMSNDFDKVRFDGVACGTYDLCVTVPEHHLMPGIYFATMAMRDDDSMETYTRICSDAVFTVRGTGSEIARGLVRVNESWKLEGVKA